MWLNDEKNAPALRETVVTSQALEILFQNILQATFAAHEVPADVLDPFAQLLKTVVGGGGQAAPVLEEFLAVITHAEKIHAHRPLSTPVVTLLAHSLATTLKEYYGKKDGHKSLGKELAELDGKLKQHPPMSSAVSSKLAKGQCSTRDLFALRDQQAQVMALQQEACQLIVQQQQQQPSSPPQGARKGQASDSAAARKKQHQKLVDGVLKDTLHVAAGQLDAKRKEVRRRRRDGTQLFNALS